VTVFLRNRHPKRAIAIPANGHWCRFLPAGATTMLPDAALRHPVTRLLLAKQLIVIVDATQYDADARQKRAGRIDIAAFVRQAEQAEFDRLLAGLRRPRPQRPPSGTLQPSPTRRHRAGEWSEQEIALLRQRASAGATRAQIAAELGRSPSAVEGMAGRARIRLVRTPPASAWPAAWTETLKRRWAEGVPGRVIAEELGVAPTVVWTRCTRLGLEKRFDNRNGGHSVGCSLNNAKGEHLRTNLRRLSRGQRLRARFYPL
jgi:hypothetical protein